MVPYSIKRFGGTSRYLDGSLYWEGMQLPGNHPCLFYGIMQKVFYGPIDPDLSVLEDIRNLLNSHNTDEGHEEIWSDTIDMIYGNRGQGCIKTDFWE